MFSFDNILFRFGSKLPLILQTESTECGLACLGMVASFYGHHFDLATLRRKFPISLQGVTLKTLIQVSGHMDLGGRPLKLGIEDLSKLKLPCILHWNFNHFVVLKEISTKFVTIHDPAVGIRKLPIEEVSRSFTGVALELWPNEGFTVKKEKISIRWFDLFGKVYGFAKSFSQILLLAACIEIFSIISPFFLQWIIDDVIVSADRDLLTTLAIGFGLLMLMQQCVTAIRTWLLLYMGTTLNVQWRANVLSHLLRLPVQYFERRHLGDVVSRFNAIDQIQHTLTTSFVEGVLDGVMTVITFSMMLMYSRTLALIAMLSVLFYALGRWIWYRPLRYATEEQIVHAAKQQSHFLETIRGIKAIKLFQRQDERHAAWLVLLVNQINADLRTQKLQLFYRVLNGIVFGAENILTIWLGAKLVLDGNFSVGVLMAFNSYKGQFGSRISSLIDKFFELKMLRLQGERLADIVLTEPEFLSVNDKKIVESSEFDTGLEISNLRYRYSEQEPYILDGISLNIANGESIAIAGPSGCGKTTLMNLLLGVLPISEGEVNIGGNNIKHIGTGSLRAIVGAVLQDDVLFTGSIAENISFFDPNADQNWISECARTAAIESEILGMSMGYNTLVGDMGTVLSGGQKQRVLLARALYKRPKILFLDEATSHLDIRKEQEVNAGIKSLAITRIIIAHRPETISTANRVVILNKGKIQQDINIPASTIVQEAA